jgi:short-subunit dehydrogenase
MNRKRNKKQAGRVVVITGASSGIGKELAAQMAAHGDRVYALARSLPDEIGHADGPGCLRTLELDVTEAAAVQGAAALIIRLEQRIDVLIQAAGFGLAGAVEAMTPQEASDQMATNYLGVCNMLPPVLAQMRQQGSGLIVQLGSVAGFLPVPFQACYSASKAAVAALIQALANEVRPYGIRCLLVQPGDTQTGFTDARVISKNNDLLPYAARCRRSIARMAADEQNGMPAAKMARLIIRRVDRRRPPQVYTPGLLYKVAALLNRLLPRRLVNAILYLMYAS